MNRCRLRLAAGATAIAASLLVVRAEPGTGPLLEPFSMVDDFEGEGLGQWASYPPAQDVGYEPSLSPAPEGEGGVGRALTRIWKPVRDGRLRLGFIKHVPFVAGSDAHLALRFRLEPLAEGASVEVGFAGADGHRYAARVPAAAGRWLPVSLERGAFRSQARRLAPGTAVEAVFVVLEVPKARHAISYRFLMDDVELRAGRAAHFRISTPAVTRRNPWPEVTATQSYAPGDRVEFVAMPPELNDPGPPLTSVACEIVNPEGQRVASVPLEQAGTGWDSSAYALPRDAAPGVWRARLRGTASGGRTVETVMRFRVRPAGARGHPRLYFDANRRRDLQRRTKDPRLSALWDRLHEAAVTHRGTGDVAKAGDVFQQLDARYLLPTLLGYFDALNRARLRIESNAFDYFVTRDEASREAARKTLLQVAAWPVWAPPWFEAHGQHTYYPAGQLSAAVAFAYDLLYPDLTDAERASVRASLMTHAIRPTYREYVLDNRVMANTSNWIAHTVGGALIAAAAIAGDGTPEEQAALEVPLAGLLQKIESHMKASYLPDGSYGEGISYQEFDAETLGPMLVALDRVFGIDYWTRTHVLESLSYPMHTLTRPIQNSLDMGDTHPPGGHGIAPIAYRSADPGVRWYVSQFVPKTIQDFIFFKEDVAPRPPDDGGSRVFDAKGNVVFRTGWGQQDLVLLFRAGPTFNHNHADQGSFLLHAYGEPLVTEAGWSDYYKDPYYATYFTQAVGHNTLLVDRNPQSQTIADTAQFAALDAHPRITSALTSTFYGSVAADLTSVYDDRLSRYTRRLVFIEPSTLLVFDEAAAAGAPAAFDWLLHVADKDAVRMEGDRASYAGEHGALGLRWFSSAPALMTVQAGHLPYGVFATSTPAVPPDPPGYFDLGTRAPEPHAAFLVVLTPAPSRQAAEAATQSMSDLAGPGWIGAQWPENGEEVAAMFRTSADAVLRHGDWTSDAEVFVIRARESRVSMLAMEDGTRLRRDGVRQLGASIPLSAAVHYGDGLVAATVDAPRPAYLALRLPAAPSQVTVDGEVQSPAMTAAGELRIALAAGRHRIAVKLP